LVNQLSIHYPQTIATINWSGAGDWSWPDELWAWIQDMWHKASFSARLYAWWHNVPKTREELDSVMAETLQNPSVQRWFVGMTYRYHADAIKTPALDYHKIHAPMLVVCGTKDSLIDSCDAFVQKAKAAQAPITYWRVSGMEHRISQNKENLIPKSFEWLKQWL
jgi:acetyl esterase/lipase